MEYKEAKDKFLQAWGSLGSQWGISRTMAQIHALLLISPRSLNAIEIQTELKISVGNTNMNLRALMDWELVYKDLIPGERKEHFRAEKDIWEVARKIITQRKRRELEPVLRAINEVSVIQGESAEVAEFQKVMQDIRLFSGKADSILETLLKADSDWFIRSFLKMVK